MPEAVPGPHHTELACISHALLHIQYTNQLRTQAIPKKHTFSHPGIPGLYQGAPFVPLHPPRTENKNAHRFYFVRNGCVMSIPSGQQRTITTHLLCRPGHHTCTAALHKREQPLFSLCLAKIAPRGLSKIILSWHMLLHSVQQYYSSSSPPNLLPIPSRCTARSLLPNAAGVHSMTFHLDCKRTHT